MNASIVEMEFELFLTVLVDLTRLKGNNSVLDGLHAVQIIVALPLENALAGLLEEYHCSIYYQVKQSAGFSVFKLLEILLE